MNKAFNLIESQNKNYFDFLKQATLHAEWLNYVVFVFENKEKNIKFAYFSNSEWGEEYANNLHALDPVRIICKNSCARTIVWERLALDNLQKDFMIYRQQKCGIHKAITLNLSSNVEFKLLTIASAPDSPCLEKYFLEHINKIRSLSFQYTNLIKNIT